MKKYIVILLILTGYGCQKEFLAVKPAKSLLVPTTLSDMQALLDDATLMNRNPSANWLATDDMITTDAGWLAYSSAEERNSYLWAQDIYEDNMSLDWSQPYAQILNSNIVLDALAEFALTESNRQQANEIKAAALFFRAFAFYNLLQKYAAPYSSQAAEDEGIILRLKSDINVRLGRAKLGACYNQVIGDLSDALSALPANVVSKTRPSKQAALAMLSRTYLTMSDYEKALHFADEYLKVSSELLDYNVRTPYADAAGNIEVLFNCGNINYSFINSTLTSVSPELYALYDGNDLRRQYYFLTRTNGAINFRPINAQNAGRFSGLATDEVYLIKAECQARLKVSGFGLDVLNVLGEKRWAKGKFIPFTAANNKDALAIILRERRKELVNRGTRWTDLRRLNLEAEHEVIIKRTVQGKDYELLPRDKRYVYPIPDAEILASGISQNIR